jgi:hypothetical protein
MVQGWAVARGGREGSDPRARKRRRNALISATGFAGASFGMSYALSASSTFVSSIFADDGAAAMGADHFAAGAELGEGGAVAVAVGCRHQLDLQRHFLRVRGRGADRDDAAGATMISAHVLRLGGRGVRSPLDPL